MASKSATAAPKKEAASAASKSAAPKYDDSALRAEIAGVREAVRRLASGAIVTEEHRDELFALLEGK